MHSALTPPQCGCSVTTLFQKVEACSKFNVTSRCTSLNFLTGCQLVDFDLPMTLVLQIISDILNTY